MSLATNTKRILGVTLILSLLNSCYRPPYNNFVPERRLQKTTVTAAGIGAGVGAIAGSMTGNLLAGTVAGGLAGGVLGIALVLHKESKPHILKELKKCDIQYVQYGDTMTLVIPTDKYFIFNSPRINELLYPALMNIVKLLAFYPDSPIYVAGFTDNVGSRHHKNLMSQAQAETMMTFLWANGISSRRLKAEGYGEKNDIGDNAWIHGSAFNRRLEIQWFTGLRTAQEPELIPATIRPVRVAVYK